SDCHAEDAFCKMDATVIVGRCSKQEDDADRDGIGDPCDTCAHSDRDAANGLLANSNHDREDALIAGGAAIDPEGDVCEQVPQFVSRPCAQPLLYDGNVRFAATAGIGIGPCVGFNCDTTFPPSTVPGLDVGFRHCDCDGLDRQDCINNHCSANP